MSGIYVAGHTGLVGSALVRALTARGTPATIVRTKEELDLTRQSLVEELFRDERPELVFLAAARVGGILANDSEPADFIYENLLIEANVMQAAYLAGVEKVCLLGSSCIYPKHAPQPIREESLLTGHLEPTNSAYAVAKIAAVEMARAYARQHGMRVICPMPTNLYGPGDHYDEGRAHVLPALLKRFALAKKHGSPRILVWGTGEVRREFLHVDDCARALLFLMDHYDSPEIINVGTGEDVTIRELASLIARIVGYEGEIVFDTSKPDGTPRKLLDVSRIHALGWRASIGLERGICETYAGLDK